MEAQTHLMINGFLKETPKELSIIKNWIFNLIQEINASVQETTASIEHHTMKITADPIVLYVGSDSIKDIRAMCIIDNGYLAMRIYEKEEDVSLFNFDICISSPLPALLITKSIAENLGMYDGTRMHIDRKDGFRVIQLTSYP